MEKTYGPLLISALADAVRGELGLRGRPSGRPEQRLGRLQGGDARESAEKTQDEQFLLRPRREGQDLEEVGRGGLGRPVGLEPDHADVGPHGQDAVIENEGGPGDRRERRRGRRRSANRPGPGRPRRRRSSSASARGPPGPVVRAESSPILPRTRRRSALSSGPSQRRAGP
ncbi:MAG: hypothetical protein MZV64_33795 [Ignavibacteriales bacterium]|nr:hypothetical protein [Ignavibacteriales bacterium]